MRTLLQGAFLVILICLLFYFVIISSRGREPSRLNDIRITNSVLMNILWMHSEYRRMRGVTIKNSQDLPKLLELFENNEKEGYYR